MIEMNEKEYTDELEKARAEYKAYLRTFEELKRRAVLDYLQLNKNIPMGPKRMGYARIAEKWGLTKDEFRGALRKYGSIETDS